MAALSHRSLATAHVNLALLSLAEGDSSGPLGERTVAVSTLHEAKLHCENALASSDCGEVGETWAMATKILSDVQKTLRRVAYE